MPSDYERILQDNLHEYGHGERHLAFLGRLYTDRTHFVYELLQNAEDAGASGVKFVLHPHGLEVLHDGRLFDEDDVRGVCGVGSGTKKEEDYTQIGKFGIGFKSVYAFTATPEIHSGDEHFCIRSYVRPHGIEKHSIATPWTTLFRFPFDHHEISAETAFQEIADRLRRLGLRTLLFLRNIEQIEWEVGDEASGVYLREISPCHGADHVFLLGQDASEESDENWLVFQSPIPLPDQDFVDEKLRARVEIAYKLQKEEEDACWEIVRSSDSPLVAFFPTEKPTNLGFLIQGPYRTTPARDNIPQHDDWNTSLICETAELLVKSLQILRDERLLTSNLLEALPIQPEAFPKDGMFRPLFERAKEALCVEDLLPTHDGDTTNARGAVLARGADLCELLSSHQLAQLLRPDTRPKWLSDEITQDRTLTLRNYLVRELGVVEFTPETLARRVSEDFFLDQSDEWMVRFYTYLLGQERLWAPGRHGRGDGPLRKKPFLRLSDEQHVAPFRTDGSPNAFLPGSCDLQVPLINRTLASDEQACQFLDRLGLKEPDLVDEVLNSVLPKYDGGIVDSDLDDEEYETDIRAIVAAIRTDSNTKRERVVQRARKTSFLRAVNAATGATALRKPDEVYTRSTDSVSYFSHNERAWFLGEHSALEVIETADLQTLGVADLPRRREFQPQLTTQEKSELRGQMKSTRSETLVSYDIDGLKELLAYIEENPNKACAQRLPHVIWNVLLKHMNRHEGDGFWHGRYEWFYFHERKKLFDAYFLQRLKTTAWLPNRNGMLCKPNELDVSELPTELQLDDDIIQNLGINNTGEQDQEDVIRKRQFAEELGVKLADIELVRVHWDEFVKWRDAVVATSSVKPMFPERASANPARREQRFAASLEEAPVKAYETRERSVRVSNPSSDSATRLRNQYTNEDDQMVCQICEQVMPFRKRNGEYYFEAVEFTTNASFEHLVHLALCPVCAAKYKEFIKSDSEALADVESALAAATSPCIDLKLGEENRSLRFVQTHFSDVKTILRRMSEAK